MAIEVNLAPPNISAYQAGNTGIDYYTSFDSGKPGPHVLVNAVTHGNELCGAIVIDFLFRHDVRPTRGALTLGFANIMAYLQFDPARPTASRFVDEDFNRLWSTDVLDGPRDSVELQRAREIRPLIDTVDLLLDLHSMQQSCPPLMLCGPLDKGRTFAEGVGVPMNVIADEGHAAGRRMRDYGAFGDPASPKNALLVECGQHWEKESAEVALETTLRFLRHIDIIDPDFAAQHLPKKAPPRQQIIEVTEAITVRSSEFAFSAPFKGLEVILKAGDVIGHDGDMPVLAPYDNCVLIMPLQRLYPGQTAVRLGRIISNQAVAG
ncbi:MAG: succinylglutamate desuccinylase [Alphaproteobacteria bacterium]|nr:succinylglutamate desuccinylase [Alphaproteobacteria bacterium]